MGDERARIVTLSDVERAGMRKRGMMRDLPKSRGEEMQSSDSDIKQTTVEKQGSRHRLEFFVLYFLFVLKPND